jgi:AraC-like DNA-binding protein
MQLSKWNTKNRGLLFWSNLRIVLLITCIPVALICVVMYYLGSDRIKTEVNSAHRYQLNQSIQQLDDYLSNLENLVLRIAFDKSMDESLNHMDFIQDFQKTKELLDSFALMTQSNALIKSVELYLPGPNKILGDEFGYQSVRTEQDQNLLHSLLNSQRLIYWDYALQRINRPNLFNKAIVIRLPGGQLYDSFGVFIIYIDQVKLDSLVRNMTSGEGISFLINKEGDYLATPRNIEIRSEIEAQKLKDALRSHIMKENFKENHFEYDWNHDSYTVSYGEISKFGGEWTIVSATPISQIIAPVTSMSNLILWISVSGLAIGLLLSWFASNKIYDPIYRLKKMFEISKSNSLNERNEMMFIENQWKQHLQEEQELTMKIKQSIPALRESFLLQFLQGNLYAHTKSEITEKMRQLEWDVEHKSFVILIVQLHGVSNMGDEYSERDVQLITFAAANIIFELCSDKLDMVHVINFQDLSVGAFLVINKQTMNEEIKLELKQLSQHIIEALNYVLRMKVTIVISKITDSITDAPNELEQARKALRFRNLHTSNQMLDLNYFMLENGSKSDYPSDLERGIIHAVSIGLEDEAVRLVKQFMLDLQNNNGTELMAHQGMMKLLGSIHDMIIKNDVNLHALYEGVHLYEQLMQIQEPDQIVNWFQYKLIRPFIQTLSMTYNPELRETIEKLAAQIDREYLSDISLEMYANQLHMTPSTLSRTFRQIMNTNFIDYIIRLRLEKCRELLVSTDMQINEIAKVLQYQPSYLIRIFKKSEGLTPGQYRELHAK